MNNTKEVEVNKDLNSVAADIVENLGNKGYNMQDGLAIVSMVTHFLLEAADQDFFGIADNEGKLLVMRLMDLKDTEGMTTKEVKQAILGDIDDMEILQASEEAKSQTLQ